MTDRPEFNQDFTDLIQALHDSNVDFMIVGAHALAFHGVVRATGDLDILVRPSAENAEQVVAALDSFGAPLSAHGVAAADFEILGTVYQIGLPPRRIDILTMISGVDYDEASAGASDVQVGGVHFRVPSRATLIANKRASGRPKDIEDADRLEALDPGGE